MAKKKKNKSNKRLELFCRKTDCHYNDKKCNCLAGGRVESKKCYCIYYIVDEDE